MYNLKQMILSQIPKNIIDARDKREADEAEYQYKRKIAFDEQLAPIKNGAIINCQTFGTGILRGIINECKYFHESRWSPCFCTHSKVKNEFDEKWKGTSCYKIGKDLYNFQKNSHPDWCPLSKEK